ncbi:uncharacterized protein BYT42DRAFT_509054 [Radiomyces spectabilis]|uniref:uncharacterized protein n=1 Tax=Radiomyces spectabilis TaxID=64574 RepID=UPI002220A4A5|nr:uncharacterized protein BYT42DRAFT_509054 [Radiomyces spectabilis]KAI8391182.1 hypothetical protein BYT42DRAFT_509054 [Radiomyces spectabilis]
MLMVHPMQLVHGCNLKIDLDTDKIALHGNADESAGVMLRGTVRFSCQEHTKVKSVTLKLEGKSHVHWTEGAGSQVRHFKEERSIIQHEWIFLASKEKAQVLKEGEYKWCFELPLPGDLPESIKHPLGEVSYRLKAVIDRPAFMMNYVAKRTLHVSRLLLPSSLELTQSILISNVWTNKLMYEIGIPRKVYLPDTKIPIAFDLVPIASNLRVRSVACTLKEYTIFAASGHQRTEGRVITHLRDDHFTRSANGHWMKTEQLYIPSRASNMREIQYDVTGDLIKVKHKLKFIVTLVNLDGHISELRASIPVIIASSLPEQDLNDLPTYEAASDSTDDDEEEDSLQPYQPILWNGLDLSRVPSYTTAVQSNRFYISGSLPTYESICVPPSQIA